MQSSMNLFDRRKSLASTMNVSTLEATQFSAITRNTWVGTRVGLLTTGDDTQGMNPAIRAVVRTGMHLGCHVVYIKHGFKGMVEGGNNFEDATWNSTSDIIEMGGTIIKSYKCPEFIERSGRLKAAKSLVENDLHHVVVIGGDGSLKGINSLYNDWPSLLQELEDRNLVDKNLIQKSRNLKAICVIASIINDIANCDHSIGANSALHRIIESIDNISTTSSSSQLAFIIQVMGQTSGYLALATGIMCDASMIFIPEFPPMGNWRDELCDKVKDDIRMGSEGILCIMCEGSIDRQGKPITPEEVKDTLQTKLKLNVKITVLGHVQRGGSPSAFDRTIASSMGVEAVSCLKSIPAEAGPSVIAFSCGSVTCLSLCDVLKNNTQLQSYLNERKFTEIVRLRGKHFQNRLGDFNLINGLRSNVMPCTNVPGLTKIGIVRIGKSTISQCMVVRSIVGFCHSKNYVVLGFINGFSGVVNGHFRNLCWEEVKRWTYRENVCMDTSFISASSAGLDMISESFLNLDISGVIMIGNFMAYQSLKEIFESKEKYKGLCIPMCVVPVTLANNIPGSENCIGADSALNEIIEYCDKMRRVARGQTRRVFVIETMGKDCGYLATMSGLCVGADAAYIKQEHFTLDTIISDADHLRNKILNSGVKIGLIVCGEKVNANYNTDFIYKVFVEQGKGVYTCRASTIGHVQVGGLPSVLDRMMAVTAGLRAGDWIYKYIEKHTDVHGNLYTIHPSSKCVLCHTKQGVILTPVNQLIYETDFLLKVPTYLPWLKYRAMMRILAKHDAHLEMDFMSEAGEDVDQYDQLQTPVDF